jgi:hypothetical protein
MAIEIHSLIFDNLITYEIEEKKENWQEAIFMLEDFALNKDVYKNGPILFSFEQSLDDVDSGHFTYFMPISGPVGLQEGIGYSFRDQLFIPNALELRQAEQELDFYAAYEKVKSYAVEHTIELDDTYYCVLLEVYGDYMIDLYVPIKAKVDQL